LIVSGYTVIKLIIVSFFEVLLVVVSTLIWFPTEVATISTHWFLIILIFSWCMSTSFENLLGFGFSQVFTSLFSGLCLRLSFFFFSYEPLFFGSRIDLVLMFFNILEFFELHFCLPQLSLLSLLEDYCCDLFTQTCNCSFILLHCLFIYCKLEQFITCSLRHSLDFK